ncbi:MAG TPA: prolipoprotein diacylglyceryl transferase [Candidatus Eisenbacteria bacterium]|nr:prolipoprotein diacylglyceryl transferase [Candidatus Eisenbacteria bacterium]
MHPILFHIGSFTVYTYGFFAAVAMLAAFFAAGRRAGRLGLPASMVYDLVLLLFVSGVAGARLFFVLQHLDDYREHPAEVLLLREGGLVWYGGFILAACAGLCYAHRRRWPVLRLCDFFAPILAVAHAFGRLGCFFNGCCFGRVTGSSLGVLFPGETFRRLPVQIYEAALLVALAYFLDFVASRRPREGSVFIAYLLGYSTLRFGLEYLRGDQTVYAGLTPPQWTSVALFAGGVFLYFILRRRAVPGGKV